MLLILTEEFLKQALVELKESPCNCLVLDPKRETAELQEGVLYGAPRTPMFGYHTDDVDQTNIIYLKG